MIDEKWSARSITDSAQRILKQIPWRASDRGLHVLDSSSIVMMTLWSLLLWERKVGRVALEETGVDPFGLARDVDRLLQEKAGENAVAFDSNSKKAVLVKTGEPYRGYDIDTLLELLLLRAEQEAKELGHNYVGSEHLLLAIVQLADPTLALVLQQHSVDHDQLKKAVLDLLHSRTDP